MTQTDDRRPGEPRPLTIDGLPSQLPDLDPSETAEWLESLDAVVANGGPQRARFLMLKLLERAREKQVGVPALRSTDYINTIPPEREPDFPGDEDAERRIRAYIRWNAAITVSRANRPEIGVGGHIATYASAASLYEVGFNHFFRGREHPGGGDQVYFQGHASPGVYARAFLEGRLTEQQLDGFRQESRPDGGLSSYPHPRLMPEFWEFPTVSMGLGPISAIYQARFNKYLQHRGIKDTSGQRVWCFLGDGEMDEPESLGAIGVAAREELDNLTFVINCNLQRLDGPVRGNGKIMQELESSFRGAGWNVVKVVWGRQWDALLAKDVDGLLLAQMNNTPDGQFQTYSVESGAYTREKFFGSDPRLLAMVQDLSDEQVRNLPRGGHDYRKVYAGFDAAVRTAGQPTVILAHTVKGWTLGKDFEGRNATHQMKKLTKAELKELRDRLYIELPDSALEGDLPPYYHPGKDSDEIAYMKERRAALGGAIPRRVVGKQSLPLPPTEAYDDLKRGSGKQPVATTMAFVRLLKDFTKDKGIGQRIVPVIPDEARTFGIDAMFPSAKIYSPHGQRYEAVDRALLLSYKESEQGQILHEGITEAGSMASVIAAGTSYATHGEPMIPVYVFYSMFGFQRTGDQMWQMADQLGRGFLLGATAGRTTLNGEGLQHQDGHSLLLAETNPAVVAYDPAFAFEVAFITEDGLRRMYGESPENVFYYLTVYNEPFPQPPMPEVEGLKEGVLRGMYRYQPATGDGPRAQLLASGISVRHALEAQQLLQDDWGVAADVWSVTSWNELRRDAVACEEHALLHPEQARTPYVTEALQDAQGPVIAVSDWMRAVPDLISRWIPGDYRSLGTDGFGRSDTRAALRRHFHTDPESIAAAVLQELARRGDLPKEVAGEAVERYQLLDEQVPADKDTQEGSSEVSG
ncbi:MAG TPA: pyruvate dehydrogenase (acetyl-transferring), homodimeric type [Mycobacteriales bacterium]|nr:pyruvate dehydrogenase (acetyl-transferring), homodimeric type [Mycobacteriales bacterium]